MFTLELVKAAKRRIGGEIHGVIFPEYSVNWPLFKALRNGLAAAGVEFLIGGSSQNCSRDHENLDLNSEERHGNFVLVSQFTKGRTSTSVTTSRPKHHRWGIYKPQPETYGLSSQFPKDIVYWEKYRSAAPGNRSARVPKLIGFRNHDL